MYKSQMFLSMIGRKNSFTIQKPGSFTCEAKAVPAPVASATRAKFASGYELSIGRTIPAVDNAATVPDPKQIRKITATAHESKIGEIVTPSKRPAMYSPTPPSIITCLNAPPPPVIKISKPIALMDAPAEAVKSFIGVFFRNSHCIHSQ